MSYLGVRCVSTRDMHKYAQRFALQASKAGMPHKSCRTSGLANSLSQRQTSSHVSEEAGSCWVLNCHFMLLATVPSDIFVASSLWSIRDVIRQAVDRLAHNAAGSPLCVHSVESRAMKVNPSILCHTKLFYGMLYRHFSLTWYSRKTRAENWCVL